MEKSNKNFNDLELVAEFGALLDTNEIVIYDISPTKEGSDGKRYFQLYISQKQTTKSEASALDELLLGYGTRTQIQRSIRNVDEVIAKDRKIEFAIGKKLGECLGIEDLFIKVTHTTTKPYADAQPVKARIKDVLTVMADSTNTPIYAITKVEVMGTEGIQHDKVKLQEYVVSKNITLLEKEGVLEN